MLDIMLEEFPFMSLWNTGIFLFVAFTAVIYLFLLPQEKDHSILKTISFLMGLVVVFFATGSPLNIIGRIQFSAHIVQVVLLCFLAPPLLLFGMKKKIFQKVLQISWGAKIVAFLKKNYITIPLFFIALYAYHHPPIFDQARVDLYGNYFYLLVLFISAHLLWLPILSKQGKGNVIDHLVCIAFVIPLGGILLFSKGIIYQAYTDMTTFTQALEVCLPPGQSLSPEIVLLLLPFEPVMEQQIGGVIWLVSGFIVFIVSLLIKVKYINK